MRTPQRIKAQAECQVCGEWEGDTDLVVDHDHSVTPKTARGKLCRSCNVGIGFLEKWLDRNMLPFVLAYVWTHGHEKKSPYVDPELYPDLYLDLSKNAKA